MRVPHRGIFGSISAIVARCASFIWPKSMQGAPMVSHKVEGTAIGKQLSDTLYWQEERKVKVRGAV